MAYSMIKTVWGALRPAFQMRCRKILSTKIVVVNDNVTKEALIQKAYEAVLEICP